MSWGQVTGRSTAALIWGTYFTMVTVCGCEGVRGSFQFLLCVRFDLSRANLNDANLDKMSPDDVPDIVSMCMLEFELCSPMCVS